MKLRLKTLTLLMGIVALSSGAIALNSFNPASEIDHASVMPVDAASDPWASLDYSSYGVSFRNSLAKLIKQTGNKTISYKSNNEVLKKSDASPTHSGAVVPFYHRDTDHTTSWNKEHTWPNSRGAGESGPGSDPHMLRPTLSSENSSRGNSFYGTGSREWDPASLGFEGARGEAARIIFYVATKYYDTHSTSGSSKATQDLNLSNNPNDSTSKGSMGTLKYLVQWNNEYPVTESEIRRNNYLDSAGFGRNPFIDNPDLANYIYDVNGLRTTPYAGGNTDPDSVYLTLSPSEFSLPVNSSQTINVTVRNAEPSTLVWYAQDSGIVSVTPTGDKSSATVTATSVSNPSASDSLEVTVLPAKEEGGHKVSISPSTWEMSEGSSLKLNVTTEPELDENGSIYYSSSDSNIATVSQDGVVTAIKEGRATISARIVGTNDMASMDLTVTFNPNLDKEVAAFDLSFNGKGITGDGTSLTIPASSSASFALEEPKDLLTITGTSEVEVYAGESVDSLSKIEKDGDSYPVSGKTHFKLSNPSSGAITITGISLSKNDPGSTPSTPSGCYGSIGGSIAAAVVVLLAISALVVVRRKKNNA